MLTQESIKEALSAVKYPGYSRDIVAFGLVKDIACGDGAVSVVIELTAHDPEKAAQIKQESELAIRAVLAATQAIVSDNEQFMSCASEKIGDTIQLAVEHVAGKPDGYCASGAEPNEHRQPALLNTVG